MAWDRLLTDLGFRAAPRATKFIAYFQLVDSCAQPGCPVCRCVRELGFRTLDGLLYEQVTDPETRALLGRSWGLCNWHAWMTREVKNAPLGVAIVYEDLLGQLRGRLAGTLNELAAPPVAARGWRRMWRRARRVRLLATRARRASCPLCELLSAAERGFLRLVLDHVTDAEFDRAYARSAGVCLPHLTRALREFPGHMGLPVLLDRGLRTLDELIRALRGFIDKHDSQKRAPFTEAEAASWTGALGFMAGQPDLFGNEIRRDAGSSASRPGDADAEVPAGARAESGETLRHRLETLTADREDLARQLQELHQQLGDQSARAASLQYRLRIVEEDRKALELNLAGERANSRTWEGLVRELRADIADLRRRLGAHEAPPPDRAS